ncbi:DUF3833 domain-containing protein [Endozoicomonas sp. SESOKO1]|uniref:DUF3833 domain-containing protein n=1 Tax=Endozoicomonas sp. SESOKO1 TaxID=2828742 RepID=UPI0021494888|nr:DUF3833 domain-containing protein [Endozoicomonas sp. SESOKO1]
MPVALTIIKYRMPGRAWLLTLLFMLTVMLTGCTSMNIEDYAASKPGLKIEDYFAGKTVAWGMFQDRFGNVQQRFKVLMTGEVNDGVLTLDEQFIYSDGSESTRIWNVNIMGDGHYLGTAGDIVGQAIGRSAGNAFNFKYQMRLPIRGREWVVTFDDWMFLQEDGVLLNVATMSKWGIKLGTLTVAFEKPGFEKAASPEKANKEQQ